MQISLGINRDGEEITYPGLSGFAEDFGHPSFYPPDLNSMSPITRAALRLATEAHRYKKDDITPQKRKKKHKDLPYIIHPIAAYNIARAAGIDDHITLAAILLHDGIEDCRIIGTEPLLSEKLEAEIENEYTRQELNAHEGFCRTVADTIASIVSEVSNDDVTTESKRFYMADLARKISPRARIVKMADGAATLLDDLLFETNMENEKVSGIHKRIWEFASGCSNTYPLLFNVIRFLFRQNEKVLNENIERVEFLSYSIEDIINGARELSLLKDSLPIAQWVKREAVANKKSGVIAVGLNEDAEVGEYYVVISSNADSQNDAINAVAHLLKERLEHRQDLLAEVSERRSFDDLVMARKIKLNKGVDIDSFIKIARETGAIGKEYTFVSSLQSAAKKTVASGTEQRGR